MTETESLYSRTVSEIPKLTNEELDLKLENAAILSEQTEMLLCCYLAAVRERKAYEAFGYANVSDYARARFSFGERKTRYLVALGLKLEGLPKIRAALASGKLGWCKASRLTPVVNPENEAMWLDSALSLSLKDLERRIRDGTDSLASVLQLPLTEDRRILWENALEIYRRRAGAEISPVEAFELMVAEVIAEWGHVAADAPEAHEVPEIGTTPEAEPETTEVQTTEVQTTEVQTTEAHAPEEQRPAPNQALPAQPVFPFAETHRADSVSHWQDEREAENAFAANPAYNAVRHFVLERDGWKCTYPNCNARKQLHVHHVRYRSRGGSDQAWNLTTVCTFHHNLIHAERVGVRGHAPMALEWTPPTLMRAVLDRRRNRPSLWAGELDVREWRIERPAATA